MPRQQAERSRRPVPDGGPVREVLDDLRSELHDRRARVVEALGFVVLTAGVLYLFSSVGADSGNWYDVTQRTTLAAIGIGLVLGSVPVLIAALVVDARVRRDARPGAVPRHLRSRRRVHGAIVCAVLLAAAGGAALAAWS